MSGTSFYFNPARPFQMSHWRHPAVFFHHPGSKRTAPIGLLKQNVGLDYFHVTVGMICALSTRSLYRIANCSKEVSSDSDRQ